MCLHLPVFGCRTSKLAELIADLSICDVVVTSDGGAMHVAAACARSVVALFGDSDTKIWHPWCCSYRIAQSPSSDVSDISVAEVFRYVEHFMPLNHVAIAQAYRFHTASSALRYVAVTLQVKILVVKRDKLGDILLATPMLHALREHFSNSCIDLLASRYNAWVMHGNRDLSHIYAYPRVRIGRRFAPSNVVVQLAQVAQLRARKYEVVIVGQGEYSPRAVQRALWVKGSPTIAYLDGSSPQRQRLTDSLVPPTVGHEAQRMLGLLAPLGIASDLPKGPPQYSAPPEAIESARI